MSTERLLAILETCILLHIIKFLSQFTEAVRGNRFCKDATNKEIEDCIKDWLRFSSDREGGRKKRREKRKEAEKEQATATTVTTDVDVDEAEQTMAD